MQSTSDLVRPSSQGENIQVAGPQQKLRLHHTRSRTVSHQKEYLDSSTPPSVQQHGGVLDQYYLSDMLEPTAPLRPRSAGAMLLTPVLAKEESEAVKSLTKTMAGVDIERVFHDAASSEYGGGHDEGVSFSEEENCENSKGDVDIQGRNKHQVSGENKIAPVGQRHATMNQKIKPPSVLNRESDIGTNLFEFKVPEFKDTPTVLTPSARHITVDHSNELHNLITPLPDQRRCIVAKRGAVFTIMVAGESGLGKTTLVNTLFGDKFKESNATPRYQAQSLDQDNLAEKTTRIEVRETEYEESGFKVKFTVIDTPGFGDYTNNTHSWVPIVNYIDDQHKLYMLQEEQPDRRNVVDTRVHACLYFIRPSGRGLLPLDIKVMQELSTRVNLIPVIGKADSFTLKDREKFKIKIRTAIQEAGIEIYCPDEVDPSRDADIKEMPYALIASERVISTKSGKQIRGRQYRWGIAEVENEVHCDFIKLRRVLMEQYMLDLIDSTIEKHHQRYRKACMLKRIRHCQEVMAQTEGPEIAKTVSFDGGLQSLVHISRYGREFLEEGRLENDPIFRERQRRMTDKFAVIVAFHEDRFESWRAELRHKQDELNEDITETTHQIEQLQVDIAILSNQSEVKIDKEDRVEGRGQGKVGKYAIRR